MKVYNTNESLSYSVGDCTSYTCGLRHSSLSSTHQSYHLQLLAICPPITTIICPLGTSESQTSSSPWSHNTQRRLCITPANTYHSYTKYILHYLLSRIHRDARHTTRLHSVCAHLRSNDAETASHVYSRLRIVQNLQRHTDLYHN